MIVIGASLVAVIHIGVIILQVVVTSAVRTIGSLNPINSLNLAYNLRRFTLAFGEFSHGSTSVRRLRQ